MCGHQPVFPGACPQMAVRILMSLCPLLLPLPNSSGAQLSSHPPLQPCMSLPCRGIPREWVSCCPCCPTVASAASHIPAWHLSSLPALPTCGALGAQSWWMSPLGSHHSTMARIPHLPPSGAQSSTLTLMPAGLAGTTQNIVCSQHGDSGLTEPCGRFSPLVPMVCGQAVVRSPQEAVLASVSPGVTCPGAGSST